MIKQRDVQVLTFLRDHIARHGRPPTRREIASACEIGSTCVVACALRRLTRLGLVEVDQRVSRGIRLTDEGAAALVWLERRGASASVLWSAGDGEQNATGSGGSE